MTIWIEAARKGKWDTGHTDKLTLLTEPNVRIEKNELEQPKRGYCQYRQSVSSAENENPATGQAEPIEVPSVLSVRQYEEWTGRGYSSAAINAGVIAAFADYEATNDPHDPSSWA